MSRPSEIFTKSVATRLPMDMYIKILTCATDLKMSISEYVANQLYLPFEDIFKNKYDELEKKYDELEKKYDASNENCKFFKGEFKEELSKCNELKKEIEMLKNKLSKFEKP